MLVTSCGVPQGATPDIEASVATKTHEDANDDDGDSRGEVDDAWERARSLPEVAVTRVQLLQPGVGWILESTAGLQWTEDGGRTWVDRTPDKVDVKAIRDVNFVTADVGWMVEVVAQAEWDGGAAEDVQGIVRVWRSADAGRSWSSWDIALRVPFSELHLGPTPSGESALVSVVANGSRIVSEGQLWRVSAGSRSPELLPTPPAGGMATVLADGTTVLVGGLSRNLVFISHDDGRSFEPPEIFGLSEAELERLTLDRPHATGDVIALPFTMPGQDELSKSKAGILVLGEDGASLVARGLVDLPERVAGGRVPPHWGVSGTGMSLLTPRAEHRVTVSTDGGDAGRVERTSGVPWVDTVSFADERHGWAGLGSQFCEPGEPDPEACEVRGGLFVTDDGGLTWTMATSLP